MEHSTFKQICEDTISQNALADLPRTLAATRMHKIYFMLHAIR